MTHAAAYHPWFPNELRFNGRLAVKLDTRQKMWNAYINYDDGSDVLLAGWDTLKEALDDWMQANGIDGTERNS